MLFSSITFLFVFLPIALPARPSHPALKLLSFRLLRPAPEQSSFRSVHAFRPHSPGRSRSACPLLCGNIPQLRLNIYSGEPLPSSFDIPAKSDYSLLNTPLILLSCKNMLALYKNNVSVISYVSIISPIVPE